MSVERYILIDDEPVIERDPLRWARWMERADRTVASTQLGAVRVSTVFLGLDHNYGENGPPLLYETMVFNGECAQDQWRYSTLADAKKGHEMVVLTVRTGEVKR